MVGPPGIPEAKVPEARTRVSLRPLTSAFSITGLASGLSGANWPTQRAMFASTPPPTPGPKWKKVTSAFFDASAGSAASRFALRIPAGSTGTQVKTAGRLNDSPPTVNETGSAARSGRAARNARAKARAAIFFMAGVADETGKAHRRKAGAGLG